MALFNKVAIVGTGLIGGSLGMIIKRKGLAKEVIGVSRHKESLALAKKIKAIDKGACELDIIKEADLLILAAPVKTIIDSAYKISKIIRRDSLVTDVGSTKQEIVAKLEKIFPNYVGSHPLAGSEKRGIINADPSLFNGSLCILTPTKNTAQSALKKIRKFWVKLDVRVVFLSPKAHDRILSFTSHLPHFSAFSLIASIPSEYLRFASTGLADTTRLAASDARLWADIALSNRKNILRSLGLFQKNLSRIKSVIQKQDKRQLEAILKKAKTKRDSFN